MKIGFIFPGQGTQSIGMGKDLYDNYEEVRKIYEKVNFVTGIDVAKLTFESSEEVLNETKNTQIAILTMSLAILEILKNKNIKAEKVAGLSLGEYTALIYSGAISFEEGIKIVQKRGEFMQKLLPEGEWLMAAIQGLEESKLEEICKNTLGFVAPANYNCTGQIVISGEKVAVEEVSEKAKELGSKVRLLKTAGPFHTEKLEKAAIALEEELKNININEFNVEVVKNLDGEVYTSKDDIREILKKHLISPVKFEKSLNAMINSGIDTFIEIGPGKVLSGFVRKMNKDVNVLNINNVETLENFLDFMDEK